MRWRTITLVWRSSIASTIDWQLDWSILEIMRSVWFTYWFLISVALLDQRSFAHPDCVIVGFRPLNNSTGLHKYILTFFPLGIWIPNKRVIYLVSEYCQNYKTSCLIPDLLCDICIVTLRNILLGALLLLLLLQVLNLLLPGNADCPIRLLHTPTEVNCCVLKIE